MESEAGPDFDDGEPDDAAVEDAELDDAELDEVELDDLDGSGAGGAPQLVAVALWRATPEVVVALDDRFGEPVDAYVNGSQVWLREDGPGGVTLEWRLHPVPGYRRPDGVGTYEVFSSVSLALATGATPPAPLEALWDGLEVFAAYGDPLEPAPLARAAAVALGLDPEASGLVDHEPVNEEWARTEGGVSIVADLFRQLSVAPPS
jgi:hypothetical protein